MVQIKIIAILILGLLSMETLYGQQPSSDTFQSKQLGEVVIKSNRLLDVERLPKIQGTNIWSGKKTEVINVQNLDINMLKKRRVRFSPKY